MGWVGALAPTHPTLWREETLLFEDQIVQIHSFTRQVEGQEAVIGRPELGVFLSLPTEALEIVDDLAAGKTVGETRQAFSLRHGETPDMEDLLEHLAAHGLIRRPSEEGREEKEFRDQFLWIPRRVAQAFFSKPAWGAYSVLVVAAVGAMLSTPGILPGWRAAYFPRDTALMLFALMILGLGTTFFHELGHVLAARANGVATRFGISHRLFFVVWETDMTGVWALPRRQRYLPILAGPLVDLLSASLLVLLAWFAGQGWVNLSPRTELVCRALLLIYLMRLLWQAYFFVRTDYYYALTNALRCKSLMTDTETYLAERWRSLRGLPVEDSLQRLPANERKAVKAYAVVWLLGRGVALSVLLFIQLPLFIGYIRLLTHRLKTGQGLALDNMTSWLPVAMFMLIFGTGMAMWLRSLIRGRNDLATLQTVTSRTTERLSPTDLETSTGYAHDVSNPGGVGPGPTGTGDPK